MLEYILRKIGLRDKWWKKDEWYLLEREVAHIISEEHKESWDIETCRVLKYKNKNTSEIRRMMEKSLYSRTTTVFDDPIKHDVKWNSGLETESMKHYDLYEGPEYE